MTVNTEGRAAPIPQHCGAAAGTPQQLRGWNRQQEGGSTAKGTGTISNGREQKGNGIERIRHLYLLENAGTHNPGDPPPKASLAKPGHTKSTKENITPSPHTLIPAQEPWSEKQRLYSQPCCLSRWDCSWVLSSSKQFPLLLSIQVASFYNEAINQSQCQMPRIFVFLILFLIFIKKTTIIKNESFTGRLQPGRTLMSNLMNKMQHSYNPQA